MTARVPTVICPGSSKSFTRLAQANSAMVTRYGVAATCGMLGSSAPTVSLGPTVTRVTEPSSWVVAAGSEALIADLFLSHAPGVGLPAVFEIVDEFLVVKATALLPRVGRHVAP